MLYCFSRKHKAAENSRLQNKIILRYVIFFRMDSSITLLTRVYISFSVAQHDVTHHPAYQPELLSSLTVSISIHQVGFDPTIRFIKYRGHCDRHINTCIQVHCLSPICTLMKLNHDNCLFSKWFLHSGEMRRPSCLWQTLTEQSIMAL
jgi:hypothetical protein